MINYLGAARPKALAGTALLRLDFNTKDDWRMRAVVPTIKLLLKRADRIVIVSHRGRPQGVTFTNGMPRGFAKDLSLRADAVKLSKLLGGRNVSFISHFRFAEIGTRIASAPRGSVFLLENLRFLPGEEKNDPKFARQLAALADFYVNDAFAVSHRANASVVAITKFMPRRFAGLELETEIKSLSRATRAPKHPVVLVLGGAKASDKLGVIANFKRKADWFLLGGGSANTALWLDGMDVKGSLKDTDKKELPVLGKIARYKNVVLPTDFVWGRAGGAAQPAILDVGPKTVAAFGKKIAAARTIIWSGPLGLIEKPRFAKGSVAVARAIARNRRAFSVSGGGETVMFLKQYKLDKKFSFISTGGGAMVDFLAGEKLPGIEALGK
jgi:phosphoglycerate kinase